MIVKLLTRAGLALAPMALVGIAEAQAPAPPAPAAQPTAAKQHNSYFTLSGGYEGDTDFSYDGLNVNTTNPAGFGIQAAYGGRFANGVRGEVGATFSNHGESKTNGFSNAGEGLWTFSLDLNAYLDTSPTGPVNFYVGAGVGVVGFHIDDGLISNDGAALSGPSVQAMVGVEFKVSDGVRIFGEGRTRQIWVSGEDDFSNTYDVSTNLVTASGGLRFLF